MNWNDLTMAQKNELMQTYIKNGVTSLNDMRSHFNSFATGGPKDPPTVLPVNEEGLPYYTLPDLEVTAKRLPQAKATDANIQRYANAVANGQLKLTQIPNIELRNRVRAVPVMNQWYKDMDRNGTIAAAGLAGTVLAPYLISGATMATPVVSAVMNNPIVDAGLTIHGAITAPKNIKEGVQELQEGNYGRGALDLGLTALDLFGATKLLKKGKNIVKNINKLPINNNTVAAVEEAPNIERILREYINNPNIFKESNAIYKNVNNIVETPKFNFDVDTRFQIPRMADLIDYDLAKMSLDDVEKLFGPEGRTLKEHWDVAKRSGNTKVMADIEERLKDLFALPNNDPDIVKGLDEAKSIYNIPEYRQRFEKFGDLGETYINDAVYRLENTKLQGRTKITGQFGVEGSASAQVPPSGFGESPVLSITQKATTSSKNLKDFVRHEGNHIGHGTKNAEPGFVKLHNEKIRPTPRKYDDTAISKYYEDMDEIVARSKTAIEYANSIKKPGESLDEALERLADMADANKYNQALPFDVRQMIGHFTKDSTLKFWKNFIGAVVPITTGASLINKEK